MPLPAASRKALGQGSHTAVSSTASSSTSTPKALGKGCHTAGGSTASSSTSAQASQRGCHLGSSTASSTTSAQASQAVSARGCHLAAGSSTRAQASQAVSARGCHLAANSSTSAQASQALGGRGPPMQVTFVLFTMVVAWVHRAMVVACVHRAGGHRGEEGCLVPPALQFRRHSRRACGLGKGDSMMHRAVRGGPGLNWPVAK